VTDVLAIVGSATPPGRLRRAVAGAVERVGDGVRAELLDLAEVQIAPADGRPPDALADDTERGSDRPRRRSRRAAAQSPWLRASRTHRSSAR
jgi:hypothetical protein